MLRVVRVGGSLLTWDRLPIVLERWLAAQSSACTVLVAGGGPWAEALRKAAIRFSIEEETAHWLGVQAMELTAHLLHALMPKEVTLVADFNDLRLAVSDSRHARVVFCVGDFLRNVEPLQPGIRLPRHGCVTSDSIAARVATVLGADELVVLKSANPPHDANTHDLAERGYVDPFFPVVSEGLSMRFENLRQWPHAAGPRLGVDRTDRSDRPNS